MIEPRVVPAAAALGHNLAVVFPNFRRDNPDQLEHANVLVTCEFFGLLGDIYSTLVVYTRAVRHDILQFRVEGHVVGRNVVSPQKLGREIALPPDVRC